MREISSRMRSTKACPASGFTLVELLIVISIIGVLVALIMPAVQSAQEAGRRAQCSNNVAQMAKGCLAHESKWQFLPTGGWGFMWAGDPDRGFNKRQPGGWHYNILPYIDRNDLHDLGSGGGGKMPSSTVMAEAARRSQTVVPLFHCPTRRKVQTYPYSHSAPFNVTTLRTFVARSDYAANGGDEQDGGATGGDLNMSIRDYTTGDSYPDYDPATKKGWFIFPGGNSLATGPIFLRSECSLAAVKDGAAYTYLLGERFINVQVYYTGSQCDNDQGWDIGFDYDTNRWTYYPPSQDRSGVGGCQKIFGSAHPAGFHMAFCDGSVRKMSYVIDPVVHRQLGNRKDGQPTQLQLIEAH